MARTLGRIKGRWHLRNDELDFPETELLAGSLSKREVWMQRLLVHMKSCGWMVQPCGEWDDGDIEVLGPGPYRLKLSSVYEEILERGGHYLRYRVTAKMKPHAPFVVAVLMATLAALTQALYLAPLAVPVILVLTRYVRARKGMARSVSQMAMDCGWPVGMPKSKIEY
jgi:hypothetical protein